MPTVGEYEQAHLTLVTANNRLEKEAESLRHRIEEMKETIAKRDNALAVAFAERDSAKNSLKEVITILIGRLESAYDKGY